MELYKMTAKNLTNWLLKLYKLREIDTLNRAFYDKQIKEAEEEKAGREQRKRNYLKCLEEEAKREKNSKN